MNLHLLPLLFIPGLLALWAAFFKRRLPCVLLLALAVVVFATFFPGYVEWFGRQQHASPEAAARAQGIAARWGWLFGLGFVVLPAFGLAKLGRYFSHRRLRKLGLPV